MPTPVNLPSETGNAWFDKEVKNKEIPELVFQEVNAIELAQPYVLNNIKKFYKTYAGYTPSALSWNNTSLDRPQQPETRALIRAGAETAAALISQHMPKPTVMTEGADFSLLQQAEAADLFLIGAYQRGQVYQQYPRAFFDSALCGTGHLAFERIGEGRDFHVVLKRVFPGEIVVPEWQCDSSPTDYTERYRVTRKSIASLKKKYPDVDFEGVAKASEYKKPKMGLGYSGNYSDGYSLSQRGTPGTNHCWVIEAYHIDEHSKRRVVVTNNILLEDEEWSFDFFPYEDLWWVLPPSGFYGDGIANRQHAKQERLNYLHKIIHKGQNLMTTPRIFNTPGAPSNSQNIADIGTFVPGRSDPKFLQQQAFGNEIYNWIETLYRSGLEDEGISQASASNFIPQGVESAPAQQQWAYKEAQRFAPVSLRYETSIAENTARKVLHMYADAATTKGKYPRTKVLGRDWIQLVDWPDLDLENDAFHIRLGASSLDTLSPAGRTQEAMNMVQMGLVSPSRARQLIKHPDLASEDSLALASDAYARAFASACMKGEQPPIDTICDLVVLREALTEAYSKVSAIIIKNPKAIDAELARQTLQNALIELDDEEQRQQEALLTQQQPPLQETTNGPTGPDLNLAPFDPGNT